MEHYYWNMDAINYKRAIYFDKEYIFIYRTIYILIAYERHS